MRAGLRSVRPATFGYMGRTTLVDWRDLVLRIVEFNISKEFARFGLNADEDIFIGVK